MSFTQSSVQRKRKEASNETKETHSTITSSPECSPKQGLLRREKVPSVRLSDSFAGESQNEGGGRGLAVNEPDDRYEQKMQRKRDGSDGDEAPVLQATAATRGSGRPLPDRTQSFFEERMGADFSGVRVHTGPDADSAARGINARAYTLGSDVVFRSGEYRPYSRDGKRLMAHELTHVVQQEIDRGDTVQRQVGGYLEEIEEEGREVLGHGRNLAEKGAKKLRKGLAVAEEVGAKVAGEGKRALEEAEQRGEYLWSGGEGNISKIRFDGSTVRVEGKKEISARAISGLMKGKDPNGKKKEAGIDRSKDTTRPKYQEYPSIGPIPEGDYFIDPAEAQTAQEGGFNPAAWGYYRTPLNEEMFTQVTREILTDRTGGFFLHEDANKNGTAGCIGLFGPESAKKNRLIYKRIKANKKSIPVEVRYSTASSMSENEEKSSPD